MVTMLGKARRWAVACGRGLAAVAGALLIVLAVAVPGRADLYSINGLRVDETAKNAVEAKNKAIAGGQLQAFDTLLRRLTRERERVRLPELNADLVSRLMDGMSVENESTSATRYVADLSIRFRPDNIRDLFLKYKVPFADEQAPGALLLPVWKEKGKSVLWDNPNPLRDAWAGLNPENSITPLLLPLGDLTDIASISAGEVVSGSEAKIQALKDRYAVENVLVAVGESLGGGSVRVTLRGTIESGPVEFDNVFNGEGKSATFNASAKAARDYLSRIEDDWKETHVNLGRPPGSSMEVAVPFGSLPEWNTIRRRIETTPGVDSVQVKRLSAQGAVVDIIFAGDLGQLDLAFGQNGFDLTDIGDTWVLQVR